MVAVVNARLHRAHGFGALHAGQLLQVMQRFGRPRLRQKHHHVLPLHIIPLVG